MSKNNTIRKSDKKFIRTEKARIRATFLDVKKQEELINNLYKKFLVVPATKEEKTKKAEMAKSEVKKETKKPELKKEAKAKPKKVASK